ncbi:uncharacterized protein LOC111944229 isoform X1 [Cyanistes caeruleus]|uniref:uncharacterized protein LOC111944229 isoform X1 n=1 Tax=Cyanistes caeruleus TaxID=156563 RepID=UPI000CDAD374|nr:uncharacterized protein LOC111944229 isoform X1 [Cyanistes caeruleus]
MAFALRLFLLLLLAVALPDRAAQAAPWRARRADEGGRKAPPAAWLHEDFLPLEPHAGVSASRTFQAPFLVAARKPSSHHGGSPRGRNKPTEDKMLSELDRRYEMNPKAVLKAAFPGGSSGSWAASAAGREAMPGTVPGDEPDDEDDPDSQSISVTEPDDEEDYEDAAGTTAHAQKIWESMRRVFYQGTDGLIKLMAIVAGGAVFLMMCCAGIWYCQKGKRSTSAASEEQPKILVSEKLTCYPRSPHLSPSAVLQLHPRLEGIPRRTPPKRDPLPLSPLALFPGQD